MKEHGADVKQKFARLSKAKRDELVKDMDVLRAQRSMIVRANLKAILKDVDESFNAMEHEVRLTKISKAHDTNTKRHSGMHW
jgi:hypothetical protein